MKVRNINSVDIIDIDIDILKEYAVELEQYIQKHYTMYLTTKDDALTVCIGPCEVLSLWSDGVLVLETNIEAVKALDKWFEYGCKFNGERVKFNGQTFKLAVNTLKATIKGGGIFDFDYMLACTNCEYTGVKKYSQTKTPIVYIND